MCYKGEQINIGKAADNISIDEVKKALEIFFDKEELKFENVSKEQIFNNDKIKEFCVDHVRITCYGVQIKKCNQIDCKFHGWIRAPMDIFNELKWLPSPECNSATGQYKSFEEVYGNEPHDKDRPGNKEQDEENAPKPTGWNIATQRARMIVYCSECERPRLIYAKKALSEEENATLLDYFEDNPLICGQHIDFGELKIQEVFMKGKLYCYAKVSKQYYQASYLEGYKLICSVCLDEKNVKPQENTQPLCNKCASK